MRSQNVIAPYLSNLEFDYFCTFTTARPCGLNSIRKIADTTYRFLRWGDLLCRGDINASMFWCAEAFDSKQGVTGAQLQYPDSGEQVKLYTSTRYHWHALLKADIDRQTLWNWYSEKYSAGRFRARCQILPNKQHYSAASYVSKYVTKQMTDYDFYISPKHSLENHRKISENSVISQRNQF